MSGGLTELAVEEIISNTDGTDALQTRFTLHELDSSHEHYQRIAADFQTAQVQILKVEKLHNLSSTDSYISTRSHMLKHRGGSWNPDYRINERYLYHGTSADIKYICNEGLDDKLAGDGCFGRGIYFSDNVKKCLKYANRREGDHGLILCARTILGESKIYEDGKTDPSLKKEPEKTGAVKGFRFYCSVKGRPREYNEFVVYRKAQTLVEYLITYSKTSLPISKVTKPVVKSTKPATSGLPSTESYTSLLSSIESDTSLLTSVEPDSSLLTSVEPDTSLLTSIEPDTALQPSKCSVSSESSADEEEDEEYYTSEEENVDPINSSLDENDLVFPNCNSFEGTNREEPEEEIDPAKKREIFIEKTGEKTDSIIDSFLWATDYHLDIAIDLYLNREKIEEEVEKLYASIGDEDEGDNVITFHPENVPYYDSDEWNLKSENEKERLMEQFLSIFMDAIVLEKEHSEFAKEFLKNNNYDIDQTIIAFYTSI